MSDAPTGADGDEEYRVSLHDFVGGRPFFVELVDRFYAGVEADEVLRPMYPEADLAPAKERLCGFLVQFWGGPDDYSRERGHPRLRARHFPFPIDLDARHRWMRHMSAAVEGMDPHPEVRRMLLDYFERSATAMVNRDGPHSVGA